MFDLKLLETYLNNCQNFRKCLEKTSKNRKKQVKTQYYKATIFGFVKMHFTNHESLKCLFLVIFFEKFVQPNVCV